MKWFCGSGDGKGVKLTSSRCHKPEHCQRSSCSPLVVFAAAWAAALHTLLVACRKLGSAEFLVLHGILTACVEHLKFLQLRLPWKRQTPSITRKE